MKMQGRSQQQFRVELLFLVQHSDSEPEEESDTLEDLVPLNIEDEESMAGSQDDDQDSRTDEEPDWANLEGSAASTEESGDEDHSEADPKNNIR